MKRGNKSLFNEYITVATYKCQNMLPRQKECTHDREQIKASRKIYPAIKI